MNDNHSVCSTRRRLLGAGLGVGAAALLHGCERSWISSKPRIRVFRPGMALGHILRDQKRWPTPSAQWSCDVLIAGSGAAALTAAWKLAREGRRNFVLIEGPEPNGNNAGTIDGELRYPTGAHYLALPSPESSHIRELLSDLGILHGDPFVERPDYDEKIIIHAPEERLLFNGIWQEEMLPSQNDDTRRFFDLVILLRHARGKDGQTLFSVPLALSSNDETWRSLDRQTFAQWLTVNGYRSDSLIWYLNYCCRDDYGQGIDRVSAWAGLHYFASRGGQARHAEKGAVLTWPDGLASLSRRMRERIGLQKASMRNSTVTQAGPRAMDAFVLNMAERRDGVDVLLGIFEGKSWRTVKVKTEHVICAMPLYIASHVVQGLPDRGFDPDRHKPAYAPWLVSNFVFDRFPKELSGVPLTWDNVVHAGEGLGYVVSTHQLIRVARPHRTSFTAYRTLDHASPEMIRSVMQMTDRKTLLELAACDLNLAYGKDLWPYLTDVCITVRGHAMASPQPGYLSNPGLLALREGGSRILFAHSDLSGYSVFEEAAWWGYQAALKLL